MKIVNYNQAKELDKLGYNLYCKDAYFVHECLGMAHEIPEGTRLKDTYQAPTVMDAIWWLMGSFEDGIEKADLFVDIK